MIRSRTFRRLSKKFFTIGAIIIVVFLVIFFSVKIFSANKNSNQATQENPVTKSSENVPAVVKKTSLETPIKKEVELPPVEDGVNQLQSENFRMESVSFGGDSSLLVDQTESSPMEIYDIKNESFLTKKGDEAKVVITWKSNKLTLAEITYARNDGQSPRTITENGFGFGHSIIITGLELGAGYVYKIKSTDHWNNKNETAYFGFYSGARNDSIVDLISKEFRGIFGWAMK